MNARLILVAGNIGAGKTSVAERVAQRLGWIAGYESVSDNPYLPDFYRDMRTWSFHLQVYFLGHRAQQHVDMAANPRLAILDRSIYEDAYIFARALYHMGNLSERDYKAYWRVFDLVTAGLPRPNMLLYLKAPVDVLMKRIRSRGRDIESGITAEYLALLDSFYDDWMSAFDVCPVLTIRSDDLDFVNRPHHLDIVIQRIQDKLAGREELILD